MSRHFLVYNTPDISDEVRAGGVVRHWASNQFKRLAPGDTLWLVTVWPDEGLSLIGRIVVGQITDTVTAEKILGTDDLWEAKYHVIAAAGTEERHRVVDISDLAGDLRFESVRDRLNVKDGMVSPTQLQTMRHLTADSVRLLEERWQA